MSESATKVRTRRAILDAAVGALARDASASLAEVASAAGVGRTTVHRYFPERADLLRALIGFLLSLALLAVAWGAIWTVLRY